MKKEQKKESFSFKDPFLGQELTLELLPVEKLEVISHQRKPSTYHVKHLVQSIRRIGFIVPLVGVKKDSKYLIVDGQHRLLAAKELGIEKLPVIIVPPRLEDLMMNFNIEKELNIREKSFVALNIYREYLAKDPNILENDPVIADSIENAYYVTLGLGYEKEEKLLGSGMENLLKKCDFFFDLPLKEALEKRKERTEKVLRANYLIKEIAQKLKEMEKWHPFVWQQIISFANPYKRKRIGVDFDELFNTLISNLEKARQDPELILKEKLEEEL